ncbi:MAG: hypothetical protein ACR2NN_20900 [Bryobacteraceae bacterium]
MIGMAFCNVSACCDRDLDRDAEASDVDDIEAPFAGGSQSRPLYFLFLLELYTGKSAPRRRVQGA